MKNGIRDLNVDRDLDLVMEIWLNTNISNHDFIDENYWKDNFVLVKSMLPKADLSLYFKNDRPVGFIGVMDGYIAGIFIKNQYQNLGIGKLLLDRAKSSYPKLTLSVYEKNERAHNFYLKNGFKDIKKSMDEDNGELEISMEWNK